MTPAERLVNHIREFINGFEQEATPEAHEMSMQLSELCQSVNDRLGKCADFLRKGMRSEAVQEALSQPSVFELAEVLSFEEARNWLNLCLDLGMVPAPELDLSTIEQLKNECTKEQLLEPLLREFRRMVHTGHRDERIHILRRLRSHDLDNPVWRENLEPLEHEQLTELRRKAGQAMAADDLETVLDIYADMTAKHRVVEVPAEAVAELERWLRKRRERAAKEEGDRLSEQLQEALEERNFEGMKPLLQAWRRLMKFADFKPSEPMLEIAAKAGRWFEDEERGRIRDRGFQEDIQKLQALLGDPRPDREKLEAHWRSLLGYERDLPEGLNNAVTKTLAELRAGEVRRRRNRSLTVLVAAAAVIAAAGAGGTWGFRTYRIEQARREVAALWTAGRHQELQSYLGRIEGVPWLYEGAGGASHATRVEAAIAAEKKRSESLAGAMEGLASVQRQSYSAGSETIMALLAEARSFALPGDESQRIESWERTWKSWVRDRQARIDSDAEALVTALAARLANVRSDRGLPLDRRYADLAGINTETERVADGIKAASGAVKERLQSLRREVAAWNAELDREKTDAEQFRRRKAELLAAIPRTAGDLAAWEKAIDEFVRSFAAAPEAEELRRTVQQLPAARDAAALAGFKLEQFPAAPAGVEALAGVVAALPAGNDSIWRAALEASSRQYDGHARMKEEIERLRMVDFFDLRQVKIRRKGDNAWTVLYIPDYFHSKELADKPGVRQYWGRVYGLNPEAVQAVPEHFSVTTDEYEVDLADAEKALVPAARYIREFLAKVPREDLLPYLLEAFDDLRGRDDIGLIPKAVVLRIVGKAIEAGTPMPGVGLEAYGKAFDGLNVNVPWYNHASAPVVEAEAAVALRLKSLPAAAVALADLQLNRQVLLNALNRRVRCVGVAWRNPEDGRLKPHLAQAGLKNLWIVVPRPDGRGNQFQELATADSSGAFDLAALPGARIALGQLLFAPTDGRETAELLKPLGNLSSRDKINWPDCWPVNVRNIP